MLGTMLNRDPHQRGSMDSVLARAFFAGGASITAAKMKVRYVRAQRTHVHRAAQSMPIHEYRGLFPRVCGARAKPRKQRLTRVQHLHFVHFARGSVSWAHSPEDRTNGSPSGSRSTVATILTRESCTLWYRCVHLF